MALVKLNNRGVRSATTFGSITGLGSMVFIKKVTASSSATVSFVDGTSDVVLDDTYKEYLFTFNNIHPASSSVTLDFQANAAGGSGYNETMTTTHFRAYHAEADDGAGVGYKTDKDQAQGTSFQAICEPINNNNDDSCSGYLHLFSPSDTTFVKHYIATATHMADNAAGDGHTWTNYTAGYFNTTSAIDAIQLKMDSGNIDAGTIKLYGIKDS